MPDEVEINKLIYEYENNKGKLDMIKVDEVEYNDDHQFSQFVGQKASNLIKADSSIDSGDSLSSNNDKFKVDFIPKVYNNEDELDDVNEAIQDSEIQTSANEWNLSTPEQNLKPVAVSRTDSKPLAPSVVIDLNMNEEYVISRSVSSDDESDDSNFETDNIFTNEELSSLLLGKKRSKSKKRRNNSKKENQPFKKRFYMMFTVKAGDKKTGSEKLETICGTIDSSSNNSNNDLNSSTQPSISEKVAKYTFFAMVLVSMVCVVFANQRFGHVGLLGGDLSTTSGRLLEKSSDLIFERATEPFFDQKSENKMDSDFVKEGQETELSSINDDDGPDESNATFVRVKRSAGILESTEQQRDSLNGEVSDSLHSTSEQTIQEVETNLTASFSNTSMNAPVIVDDYTLKFNTDDESKKEVNNSGPLSTVKWIFSQSNHTTLTDRLSQITSSPTLHSYLYILFALIALIIGVVIYTSFACFERIRGRRNSSPIREEQRILEQLLFEDSDTDNEFKTTTLLHQQTRKSRPRKRLKNNTKNRSTAGSFMKTALKNKFLPFTSSDDEVGSNDDLAYILCEKSQGQNVKKGEGETNEDSSSDCGTIGVISDSNIKRPKVKEHNL